MNREFCRLLLSLSCAAIIPLLSSGTAAQAPMGSIDVTVKDPADAVVPGATVIAINEAIGISDRCETDQTGFCRVKNLPAGLYRLRVQKAGFAETVLPHVEVRVAYETPVSVQLRLGAATQIIDVTSEAQLVQTTAIDLATVIDSTEVKELPLLGRGFSELVKLVPGFTGDASSAGIESASSGVLAAGGNRGRSNNLLVDGVDANDNYRNIIGASEPGLTGPPATLVPLAAVQESRISTNFGAEFGRNSGSLINVVLKSGTNEFHGTIFEVLSNDVLNARNFFNSIGPKNQLRYNDFGFSTGGRFVRNKAFWFANYEGQRGGAQVSTISAVPTNLDFDKAIIALRGDPSIPPVQNPVVNSVIRNLLSLCIVSAKCPGGKDLWPQPTPTRAGQVLNSVAGAPSRTRSDNVVVKVDFLPGERNRFAGHYSFANDTAIFPLALAGGDYLPRTNTLFPSRTQLASTSFTRVFSPNKTNELSLGWTRFVRKSLDDDPMNVGNPARSIGLDTGVTNSRDFGLPHLVVRGFASLGSSPFSNPRARITRTWHAKENFLWLWGKHDLKMGYEFRRSSIDSFNDANFRGSLEFASIEEFLAGKVVRGAISTGSTDRSTAQNSHAGYLSDSLRLLPSLTLFSGLRWEYFGVINEGKSLFSIYDPMKGLVIRKKLYDRDLTDFSPRMGFAWDIGGKQKRVLRAGVGLYFDAFPQDFLTGQILFNTFVAGVAYNPISPRPVLMSRSPSNTIQLGFPVFPLPSFMTDTRDAATIGGITTPYVLNYNLTFQEALFRQGVFQIAYVGSAGHKLFRLRDINFPAMPGGGRPFDGASVLSTVAPNRPFIVNQLETSANSNYNALEISYEQRPWHGWTNSVSWTWSHSIDDASDGYDFVPNQAFPNNSRIPSRERANSSFDARHRFIWSSSYTLPRVEALGRWGEGWQVAGILTLSSGQPYQVNFGDEFDSQGAYDFILRPDLVGNPILGTRQPNRLLNLAAFQVPCTLDGLGTDVSHCVPGTLRFGNLPRNAFVGPDFRNLDFSILKTTRLRGERWKLLFRAEFFNFLNHPTFSSPLLPNFIARASLKGIGLNGRGGARGTDCDTVLASDDCYLPTTFTPDAATTASLRVGGGSRSIQFSLRIQF